MMVVPSLPEIEEPTAVISSRWPEAFSLMEVPRKPDFFEEEGTSSVGEPVARAMGNSPVACRPSDPSAEIFEPITLRSPPDLATRSPPAVISEPVCVVDDDEFAPKFDEDWLCDVEILI